MTLSACSTRREVASRRTTSAPCWPRSRRESRSSVAMRRAHSACCGRCRNPGRPSPLPDLLALRGRAEIATGDALRGVRTFEERAALLASPAARAANDRLLFDQLLQRPPGAVTTGRSVRARARLARTAGHRDGRRQRRREHSDRDSVDGTASGAPRHVISAQCGPCTTRLRDDRRWAIDEHRLAVATFGKAAVGWRCGPRWLCSGLVRFVVRRYSTARRAVRHGRARRRRGVSARDRRRCPDGRRTADQGRNRAPWLPRSRQGCRSRHLR